MQGDGYDKVDMCMAMDICLGIVTSRSGLNMDIGSMFMYKDKEQNVKGSIQMSKINSSNASTSVTADDGQQ